MRIKKETFFNQISWPRNSSLYASQIDMVIPTTREINATTTATYFYPCVNSCARNYFYSEDYIIPIRSKINDIITKTNYLLVFTDDNGESFYSDIEGNHYEVSNTSYKENIEFQNKLLLAPRNSDIIVSVEPKGQFHKVVSSTCTIPVNYYQNNAVDNENCGKYFIISSTDYSIKYFDTEAEVCYFVETDDTVLSRAWYGIVYHDMQNL